MIRNYKSEDYKQLIELLKNGNMFDERADKEDLLEEKITNQPGSIIVYEKECNIIGCCYYSIDPTIEFIYRLCIKKEHRQKGVGTALMEEIEKRIKKANKKRIPVLLVARDNEEAINFYKKRGWEPHKNKEYFIMEKDI